MTLDEIRETARDWVAEIAAWLAETTTCLRCGDRLVRSPAILGAWLSADVPVPGIGQDGERPGVCRAGTDPLGTPHQPGEVKQPTRESNDA